MRGRERERYLKRKHSQLSMFGREKARMRDGERNYVKQADGERNVNVSCLPLEEQWHKSILGIMKRNTMVK